VDVLADGESRDAECLDAVGGVAEIMHDDRGSLVDPSWIRATEIHHGAPLVEDLHGGTCGSYDHMAGASHIQPEAGRGYGFSAPPDLLTRYRPSFLMVGGRRLGTVPVHLEEDATPVSALAPRGASSASVSHPMVRLAGCVFYGAAAEALEVPVAFDSASASGVEAALSDQRDGLILLTSKALAYLGEGETQFRVPSGGLDAALVHVLPPGFPAEMGGEHVTSGARQTWVEGPDVPAARMGVYRYTRPVGVRR